MVGVTDVHAERHAEQLAAEMVLEPGTDDLLAVIEIFRADETDHAIDQQGIESARDRVGARFAGLLVDAVMGVGRKRRALPGLEIHHIAADATAPKRESRLVGLPQDCEIDPKTPVGGLRSRNRLKHQIDRQTLVDQSERGRHMGQNASLGRNLQPRNDIVEQPQEPADHSRIIAYRIDANAGVTRSQHDAVEDRSSDAPGVIERMIGLQPHAHSPAQTNRVAKG